MLSCPLLLHPCAGQGCTWLHQATVYCQLKLALVAQPAPDVRFRAVSILAMSLHPLTDSHSMAGCKLAHSTWVTRCWAACTRTRTNTPLTIPEVQKHFRNQEQATEFQQSGSLAALHTVSMTARRHHTRARRTCERGGPPVCQPASNTKAQSTSTGMGCYSLAPVPRPHVRSHAHTHAHTHAARQRLAASACLDSRYK